MVILRKPTPVGILLNTMVDGETGILLTAEINEGAEEDAKKAYYVSDGAHTSICLRLTEPYVGSGRFVVGDSRFGSVRCAYALRKTGLYSIMNVKRNTKRFIKAEILE